MIDSRKNQHSQGLMIGASNKILACYLSVISENMKGNYIPSEGKTYDRSVSTGSLQEIIPMVAYSPFHHLTLSLPFILWFSVEPRLDGKRQENKGKETKEDKNPIRAQPWPRISLAGVVEG
jgi:hypothetical protein